MNAFGMVRVGRASSAWGRLAPVARLATSLAAWFALGHVAFAQADATPSRLYGPLYQAVEMSGAFADAKTFADAAPKVPPAQILAEYTAQHLATLPALRAFVERDFDLPLAPPAVRVAGGGLTAHIEALWPVLTRSTPTVPVGGSAIALPGPYVVPGGRFRELYYWDSYFTMLGLERSGRDDLAESIVDDFGSLIDRYGHIPNGARTYYLSRSQPPVFALMTSLTRDHRRSTLLRRIAWMRAERAFWMAGAADIAPGHASRRVVRLADGALLNRYWDDDPSPRDESYREDVLLARSTPGRDPRELWRNLRAAAESGWDFSSRWLADGRTLATIRTTRLAPVDLNSLMYLLERTIAADCAVLSDRACAMDYARQALARRRAILAHMFNGAFFADYDLDSSKASSALTAAAAFPLFARLATPSQARATSAALSRLVGDGGLAATTVRTGQQWDAPNGWAPLQWVAIDGLRAYGRQRLADLIASRWLATVKREYAASGRLLEKYDVMERRPGGGGEYPLQDGFGWTNGVTLELLSERRAP